MAVADDYHRILHELEALHDAGRGDTSEAEALRERLDAVWRKLTGQETCCAVLETA